MRAREHFSAGAGLILYGPRDTGKDHLLVGVAYLTIKEAGLHVHWENDVEMFAAVRRAIGEQRTNVDAMVGKLARHDVLAIGDPLPPTGPLTEFQQEFLFRVVDRRYSNRRSTSCTLNLQTRKELEDRLGASIADRMLEDATIAYCRWKTIRKTVREARATAA